MKQWIICKWKETGAYLREDAINGKTYKSQKIAERVMERKGMQFYVVRSV